MKKTFFVISAMLAIQAFAHGGDAPGPHGGRVDMPGPFHTELVATTAQTVFDVYLLDMDFKNPTVENSSVRLSWKKAKVILTSECAPEGSRFRCQFKKAPGRGGVLILKAMRGGAAGNEFELQLPAFKK